MKMQLVIEHDGQRVTVEPSPTEAGGATGATVADRVAAFDGSRLIRLASCVFACMAQSPTSAQHGQEQPGDGQGDDGQRVEVKNDNPHGNPRRSRPG